MSDSFVLMVDSADAEELNAVHEVVRDLADGWWHHMANVWILDGRSAREWRDSVKTVVAKRTKVLVVRMDRSPGGGGRWAYAGFFDRASTDWLRQWSDRN